MKVRCCDRVRASFRNFIEFLEQTPDFVRRRVERSVEYIEQAPHRVNLACQAGGVLVMVAGVLGVFRTPRDMEHMTVFIVHFYLVFFGMVTLITESHPNNNSR